MFLLGDAMFDFKRLIINLIWSFFFLHSLISNRVQHKTTNISTIHLDVYFEEKRRRKKTSKMNEGAGGSQMLNMNSELWFISFSTDNRFWTARLNRTKKKKKMKKKMLIVTLFDRFFGWFSECVVFSN